MSNESKLILAINTGSTSTKVAIYRDEEKLAQKTLNLTQEEIDSFKTIDEQLDFRTKSVVDFLNEENYKPSDFDIVSARGCALPKVGGGATKVDQYMIDLLNYAPPTQHAARLSCLIGHRLTGEYGTPIIIYDPPIAEEVDDIIRITGRPEIQVAPYSHVLNSRKVGRLVAEKIGKDYEDCNFIIAHLGGGIGIGAHRKGVICDVVADDCGPMSPERAGRIPSVFLANLCYSGKYPTEKAMQDALKGNGGVYAYLGTKDMLEVHGRIKNGDKEAEFIARTMFYEVSKAIGEMAAILKGEVDRIILTGSIAYNEDFCSWIAEYVDWIAPIEVIPGEREMDALATGGLRVLKGLEIPAEYRVFPAGIQSLEEFNAKYNCGK